MIFVLVYASFSKFSNTATIAGKNLVWPTTSIALQLSSRQENIGAWTVVAHSTLVV